MAGLTSTGLTIKRQPEVLSNIVTAEQNNIDPDISTRDDELLGQLNNVLASSIAEVWEVVQAVYDSFNILKAEGKNLDDLGALRGVARISASKTSGSQHFVGADGTTIPAGYIVENPSNGDRFSLTSSVTITTDLCYSAEYVVANVLNSTQYTIRVNSVNYDFTSDSDATASEILAGIQAQMDADTNKTFSVTVVDDVLTITTTVATQLSATATTYLVPQTVTSVGFIESLEEGPIVAPANAVVKIVTSTLGWDSTYNPAQLIVGRLEETDEEFRQRIAETSSTSSTATVPAIQAALLANVEGITSVSIVENTTAVTDVDGRPAHSFEVVIVGGDNEAIAAELWRTKPAGIATYGNTSDIAYDDNGNPHTMYFTRPLAVVLAVRVTYTKYDEEQFSAGADQTIEDTVIAYVNSLGVDKDVIPSRMFGPIYNAVSGLDSVVVEVQVLATSGDAPVEMDWQTTKLAIDADEFANLSGIDVTIVDATP